jgi:hypothetical protein
MQMVMDTSEERVRREGPRPCKADRAPGGNVSWQIFLIIIFEVPVILLQVLFLPTMNRQRAMDPGVEEG